MAVKRYNGTDWVTEAGGQAGAPGLIPVKPSGATNGTVGTNGAVTIGTAVSSVTVAGAFTGTYDNYKIVISGGAGSASAYLKLKLGASAANYYGGFTGIVYATNSSSSANLSAAVDFSYSGFVDTANGLNASIELISPFSAKPTYMNTVFATNGQSLTGGGYHNVSTSYTDFTITPASGTLTGGTIRIYGYNNN